MSVPPLPPLSDGLLAAHHDAHEQLAACWHAHAHVQSLGLCVERRLLAEAHAKVQSVRAFDSDASLFPRPRSFLTTPHHQRIVAAGIAFRHVDARLAMVRRGDLASVIDHSTPMVLNAIMEGHQPTGIESNAGILRATQSKWLPDENPMEHPRPAEVPELVSAAIDVAVRAPAPAIARAGWLAFTMLSIHPFVDGNGRTARMLFQALSALDVPLGVDWGAIQQFSFNPSGYVASLEAGQAIERYDASRLDPLPFMMFATACSVSGARTVAARFETLAEEHARRTSAGVEAEAATVTMAVELWGIATLEDLDGLGLDGAYVTEVVNGLVRSGRLIWAPLPPSRRPLERLGTHGLVVP